MNWLEIIGFSFGVLGVLFSITQNKISWIFGLLSSISLFLLFYKSKIYGQSALQFVSIIQCVYGWINWNKVNSTVTTKTNPFILYLALIVLATVSRVFYSNDILPYLDILGGLIAIFATFLLIYKKIEAWWIFMINNLIVIGLSLHMGLYLVGLLNLILFLLSIKGYIEWEKNLKQDEI